MWTRSLPGARSLEKVAKSIIFSKFLGFRGKVWLGAAKPASKGHGKDLYLDSLDEAKLQEVANARGVKLRKDDDKAKTKAELQAELHSSQTAWLQKKDYSDAQLDAMHAAGDGGQAQVAAIAAARPPGAGAEQGSRGVGRPPR